MEEWKEYKLGDIYEVHNGLSKGGKFFGSGFPFLSFSTIFKNWFIPNELTNLVQSTEKEQKSYSIKKGDIFVTRTSETADELGMSCVALKDYPKATYNGFCKRMRQYNQNVEIDPRFIGYYLRNPTFRLFFQAFSGSMSTRASLTNEALLGLPLNLPPLPIQQKIAAILSSLDDKIDLNNKINTNLEQQAQALFKNWFVDNESELIETEIGKMDILITDYVANGSFKDLADNVKYLSNETDNVLIRLTDYNNNFSSDMVYISDESYKFLEKSKLFGDEIIISNVGANVGTVFRCPRLNKQMSLAPNSIMIRGGIYEHYLYLYFTSTYGQGLLKSIVTGSAQPKFNKTNFRSLKIKIPKEEKLEEFNSIYDSLYEKIINNQKENLNLASLRNTLLPKLMNGEIETNSNIISKE